MATQGFAKQSMVGLHLPGTHTVSLQTWATPGEDLASQLPSEQESHGNEGCWYSTCSLPDIQGMRLISNDQSPRKITPCLGQGTRQPEKKITRPRAIRPRPKL
ncbi:MAG: hypothetical protein JXM70_05265 [Pirellulales bacterium]|nr:hypothetical protein [Pirellulales bacterium]